MDPGNRGSTMEGTVDGMLDNGGEGIMVALCNIDE